MKKIIFLFLLVFLISSRSWATSEQESLFVKANQAYVESNYEEALKYYMELKQSGYTAPELEYNIGNSYNKLGQKAEALLAYERALLLNPNDSDIKHNRDFTANILAVETEIDMAHIEKLSASLYKAFNSNGLNIFIVFLNALFFALLGLKLFCYKELKIYCLLLCLFLLFSAILEYKYRYQRLKSTAMIMSESADLHYEPSESSTVYFRLIAGEKLKVIKKDGAWMKVLVNGNRKAWIKADNIEFLVI